MTKILARQHEITAHYLKELDKHISDVVEKRTDKMFEIRDFANILHIHPTHLTNTIKLTTGNHPCFYFEDKILSGKDMTVTMLVTFNVKPEYIEQFEETLLDDLRNARKEAGNISMELFRHKEKENVFYFFERWVNQAALDEHFEKPYTKNILELSKVALTSPMEINYLEDIAPLPKAEMKTPSSTDTPIDLIVVFDVKDGLQQKFVEQFEKSVTKSRPEQGNILFHFHKVQGNDKKYVLYERWRNQTALDSHFEEPYTKELFDVFTTTLAKPIEESLNFLTEIGHEPREKV